MRTTIAGQPATVCIYGDGWGTDIWAGNANTQNFGEFLPPQVQVTSPVTGETYDMDCAPRGERLVSCTGGDGAEVFFYSLRHEVLGTRRVGSLSETVR